MTQDYTFAIKIIIIFIFQKQNHIKARKEKTKGKQFQPYWILYCHIKALGDSFR